VVAPQRTPVRRLDAFPPPLGEGSLRVDALTHIPAVLRDLGLDPAATLAATGLAPSVFDDPRNGIPMATLGRLLAVAVAKTGCEHVGLLIGARSGSDSLGLVGQLVRHSPDVSTALRNLVAHLQLRDRGAVVTLSTRAGVATLGYDIYQAGVEAGDQICDGAMAIAANILRDVCGPAWRPTEVWFAHQPPADPRTFRRCFDGAALRFDVERTALAFPARWLERPIPAADPARFRELERRVAELDSGIAGDFVNGLRRMLRVSLLTGGGSVGEVADRLALHRRTLNRRLRVRGTTLHRLVEETRFEIARQLVEYTRMPLTEVAAALGYGEASAFTRAFRRWAGRVPSEWRRIHAVPGARGRAAPADRRGVHG
jgi:AraC-like DNA-binding protein